MSVFPMRRLEADANVVLRAALGIAILVAVTWLYWSLQLRP